MNWPLRIVEDANVFFLLCLLLVLSWIGASAINGRPHLASIARQFSFCVLLGYLGYRGYTHRPKGPEMLLVIVLRGLIAAGYALVVCWIILPVLATIRDFLAHSVSGASRFNRPNPSYHREPERRPEVRPVVATPPMSESQRAAEAARIEAENRRTEELNQQRLVASKRREEARLRMELLYERHARELSAIFPRERFDAFIKKYLNDEVGVDSVEEREKLLRETINDALGTTSDIKFGSIQELAAYFQQRREEIQAMPFSDDVRDAYLVQLNKQEDAALRKFLRT